MVDAERILIVGGGIAGLTLATALHAHGFEAELIERSPVWQALGAGIAVQPNAMHILRALGLASAVEQAGAVIRSWDYCDQQGELLCETDLEALWGNVDPFIGIERSALHHVLLAAAAPVPSRLGISIESLTQRRDSVCVRFTDGTVGTYGLVVGADGIGSAVRCLVFSTAPPAYAGQMSLRSVTAIQPGPRAHIQMFLGEGRYFGICPVGNGRTYAFANVMEPRFHDPAEGRLNRLRERFSGFGSTVQAYLAALTSDDQIHASAIEWVDIAQWHCGRVILIGDAAHAMAPMMAQGGCMAMEDAYVLAQELRSAASVEAALDSYSSRRTSRVTWVQVQSRMVGEGFRVPPAIRNATLRDRGDEMFRDRFRPLIREP